MTRKHMRRGKGRAQQKQERNGRGGETGNGGRYEKGIRSWRGEDRKKGGRKRGGQRLERRGTVEVWRRGEEGEGRVGKRDASKELEGVKEGRQGKIGKKRQVRGRDRRGWVQQRDKDSATPQRYKSTSCYLVPCVEAEHKTDG